MVLKVAEHQQAKKDAGDGKPQAGGGLADLVLCQQPNANGYAGHGDKQGNDLAGNQGWLRDGSGGGVSLGNSPDLSYGRQGRQKDRNPTTMGAWRRLAVHLRGKRQMALAMLATALGFAHGWRRGLRAGFRPAGLRGADSAAATMGASFRTAGGGDVE